MFRYYLHAPSGRSCEHSLLLLEESHSLSRNRYHQYLKHMFKYFKLILEVQFSKINLRLYLGLGRQHRLQQESKFFHSGNYWEPTRVHAGPEWHNCKWSNENWNTLEPKSLGGLLGGYRLLPKFVQAGNNVWFLWTVFGLKGYPRPLIILQEQTNLKQFKNLVSMNGSCRVPNSL